MKPFKATAYNDQGFTFAFFFENENWYGIEEVAKTKLAEIVANDSLHQKNGPWLVRNIDVGY